MRLLFGILDIECRTKPEDILSPTPAQRHVDERPQPSEEFGVRTLKLQQVPLCFRHAAREVTGQAKRALAIDQGQQERY